MGKKTATPAAEALVCSFLGEIEEDSVDKAVKKITKWSLKNPDAELLMYLNSPGGELWAGWRLFDTLRAVSKDGHHVTITVRGRAASMAGVVLQAADHRVIGAQSYLHMHETANGAYGKTHRHRENVEFLERAQMDIARVYAERSTLKAKEIYQMFDRKEVWLSAKEALGYGFVDAVEGKK
ncbi:ATP-dependent Clp protease proteolytic subunit [Jiangella anatolica]|uniref:ATP-dependent Clp protease proteolytic subunit n=1 Tax=Jiangella anatolica TaxID=2670374 RepID=A0A2W2BAS1_9ACTN|nr:ATP-dependent Clp protease proteolytic subunit [Jiangella anatolica]PZF83222.1 hypothetical protein C1I92_13170 [Jiangella anatolica]